MEGSVVDRLLENMSNMYELGRQRAFEVGNPFYAQFEEDGEYYRKEMPNDDKYLVTVEVTTGKNGLEVKDTFIKKMDN